MKKHILGIFLLNIFLLTSGFSQQTNSIIFEKIIDIPKDDSSPTTTNLQANGNILVSGINLNYAKPHHGSFIRQQALWSFDQDGNENKNFGEQGVITHFMGRQDNIIRHTFLLADGAFLQTGKYGGENYHGIFLSKRKSDGSLDSTFGKDGFLKLDFNKEMDWHADVALIKMLPDSSILICGNYSAMRKKDNQKYGFYLAKVLPNGKLDSSFGEDGIHHQLLINELMFSFKLLLDENGEIFLFGTKAKSHASLRKLFLMKFSHKGELNKNFGKEGVFSFSYKDATVYPAYFSDIKNNQVTIIGKIAKAGGYSRIAIFDINLTAPITSNLLEKELMSYNFNEGKQEYLLDVLTLKNGSFLLYGKTQFDKKRESFFVLLNPDMTVNKAFGKEGYLSHKAGNFRLSNVSTGCLLNQKEAFFAGSIYENGDWNMFLLKLAIP